MRYDYKIAIPSSNRANTIQHKTLAYLADTNIDTNRVDIHIRREDETAYRNTLDPNTFGNLVIFDDKQGVREARNHIARYYDNGTYLLSIDDDIDFVQERVDDKTLLPVNDLEGVIEYGFDQTMLTGYRLWGIHYANNALFMNAEIRVGLTIIAGGFFGFVVDGTEEELVSIDDYEDVERSFNYYLKDGGLVRLDKFSTKTKYRQDRGTRPEAGGMQDYRSYETTDQSARYLAKTYPELCDYRIGKDGLPCVKVRDKRIIRKRSTL